MTTGTLTTATMDDQVVPSLHRPDLLSSHHLNPHGSGTASTYDTMFAYPSPDLSYPRQHQHRAHSVTAVTSELERSVLRHHHHHHVAEQRRHMPQDQPWWQYYYQLYHYHPPPGRKPTVFGPYLLLRTLGEGEFGKVKLAVHSDTGKEVAIKLIKKDNIDSTTRMSKIEREISVLRTVRHPYIVKLYDVIETERYIGIILQCASGGELFEYILAHRYLKERDAARLFAELISGVHYMHQKHIVHRDLKLENLLLDKNKSIIITDFGFANQIASGQDDLMATSCGSPCYAAPELVVSEGMYVGSAVDIWSCGVILYAMLCGYLPFDDDPANPDGDNINLLYKYILNTKLAFPDYVSHQARDLLRKMLVPDPARRCTMETIMSHPWLSDHQPLFQKTVQELEMEAMMATEFPVVKTEPSRPLARKHNDDRRNTYSAPSRTACVEEEEEQEEEQEEDDDNGDNEEDKANIHTDVDTNVKQEMGKDDMVSNASQDEEGSINHAATEDNSVSSNAMDIDEQAIAPSPTQPVPFVYTTDSIKEEDEDAVAKEESTELETALETSERASVNPPPLLVSSFELPPPAHAESSSNPVDQYIMSEQPSTHTDPHVPKEIEIPRPSPSPSTKKRGEKILSFLAGSTHHPTRTSKRQTRPFSMTMDSRTSPGNSILHAKFLSSIHRFSDEAGSSGKPGRISMSMSTPQGIHAPDTSLAAAATQLSQNPCPTTGQSQPTRGRRPKALSLLVSPMSGDKNAVRLSFRRQQPITSHTASPSATESSSSMVIVPSQSEQTHCTDIPTSPTSPDMKAYKHRSAGKKFMDWFKAKPQSKDRLELPTHHAKARTTSARKSMGSYTVDLQDAKLRTHHGAVDQSALTSRAPQQVFADVRQTLVAMGIDVKGDGEFKLKCARRKRPEDFNSQTNALKTSPDTNASNHASRSRPMDKKRKMSTNTPKLKMLLRRSNHTTPTLSGPAITPSFALYGDPVEDPGEEVKFSVELCKINNLPGLYIVDVRRMRGNVWSYKHLYHAVLDALDLSGKGGYMSTRTPSQESDHISLQNRPAQLGSTGSSQGSSLSEHKDES